MDRVKNLKKFGWTSLIIEEGKALSCILIKKNLIKGYTIIDFDGEKMKKDDLSFLNDSNILNQSWQPFYSKKAFLDINDVFDRKIVEYNNEIRNLENRLKDIKNQFQKDIQELKNQYQNDIQELKKENERQNIDDMYHRIAFLEDGLVNFGQLKRKEIGEEVVSLPLNDLQRSIGMTCNIVLKPYERDDSFCWKMDEYFEHLVKEVPDDYKLIVETLMSKLNILLSNIKLLKKEYDNELYFKTVALEVEFANSFKDFIILWRTNKGNDEVSYYSSYDTYGRGDEKSKVVWSSYWLIKQGEEACANLLGLMLGEDIKNKFIYDIQNITNNYVSDETNIAMKR